MENSKQAFENEVELIKKIDPSIKSFDDVINSESFAEVDRIYRAGGKSLSEAFKLANFDRLMSANEGKLRQQVINQMSGKDHLKGNGSGGSKVSTVTIPEETLKIWATKNETVPPVKNLLSWNGYITFKSSKISPINQKLKSIYCILTTSS